MVAVGLSGQLDVSGAFCPKNKTGIRQLDITLLGHRKTDSGEITCGIEIRRKIDAVRQFGKIKTRQIGFLVRFRCRTLLDSSPGDNQPQCLAVF